MHSNLLGLHVSSGNWITDQNIRAMTAGLYAKSSGIAAASARAIDLIAARLRLQAYSLSLIDGFLLIAWSCACALILVALLRKSPLNYGDLSAMQQMPAIRKGVEIMKRNAALFVLVTTGLCICVAAAQETEQYGTSSRHITLQEAVQLALKHNHDIRIAGYTVEEKQHAKQVAKSSYFPSIRNDSNFMHVTDTELIEIKAGSLGVAGGTSIPPRDAIISQGGKNFITSGTQITQPLTTLLKIKQENDVAQAELKASREKAQLTGNDVALAVHQVYYTILDCSSPPRRHRSTNKSLRSSSKRARRAGEIRQRIGTGVDREPRTTIASKAGNADD